MNKQQIIEVLKEFGCDKYGLEEAATRLMEQPEVSEDEIDDMWDEFKTICDGWGVPKDDFYDVIRSLSHHPPDQ